jgi:hypothetical protein
VKDLFAHALAEYESGRLGQASASLAGLLERQPHHVPALILSGIVAGQRLELDAALRAFDRALAVQPDNPRAHFNKANILLLRGEWDRGWRHYERRLELAEIAPAWPDAPAPPLWLGAEPLNGKRILLRCEQGLGDTLQFCRYVKSIAAMGAHVILEAQRPLVSLLADLEGLGQIVTQGRRLPECDFYCPLMSLPLACKTTVDNVPEPQPYLTSDAAKRAEWRARLGEANGPRVGLVWRGTAARANDDWRSLPLQSLLPHLPAEFSYVSLQKHLHPADAAVLKAHPGIANYADQLHDFSDTAALCDCVDIIVSIDTSVAHLSAALGRPTWILLPFSPAWRWLLEREDSPWYLSARLFRQTAPQEWLGVFASVAEQLRTLTTIAPPR